MTTTTTTTTIITATTDSDFHMMMDFKVSLKDRGVKHGGTVGRHCYKVPLLRYMDVAVVILQMKYSLRKDFRLCIHFFL